MQPHTRGLVGRGAALVLIATLCIGNIAPLAFADTTTTDPTLNATSTSPVATSTQTTGGQDGATIITGDATASTSVQTDLNTTTVSPDEPGKTSASSITASTTDQATTTVADQTSADTGQNVASSTDGLSTIVTGVASAVANVINEVNTNIFNSDGLILFLNQLFGGGFDLNFYDLSFFFAGGPGASPSVGPNGQPQCTLLTCLNSSALNVLNTNDATVTNDVIVRSNTGLNQASSTGDATIGTGDAYSAANVVNLVNTNIVNSSYLLLSFNNFGDLTQNVTLPGSAFWNKLFASGVASSSINASSLTTSGTSTADLLGTTTVAATTGDNLATTTNPFDALDASSTSSTGNFSGSATTTLSGTTATTTGSGAIATGAAYSSATAFNQINHTGIGGTSVFLLFRVSGAWQGHIVGLPQGLTANIIPDGSSNLIEILSQDGTTTSQAAQILQKYNSSSLNTLATSSANVANNIDVGANTGGNQATSSIGLAQIATGKAYAAANVVNLINTNIVGQNWIFGVFNVFGNMSGDIVFSDGAPALSLAASASPGSTGPGGTVTYTFIVTNTGDADAQDVLLNATFDNTLLHFGSAGNASSTLTGETWDVGLVPKGSSRTFTFDATVGSNFPAGQTATVPLSVAAVNNVITAPATSATAHADIAVSAPGTPGGGGGGGNGPISFGGGGGGLPSTAAPQVSITASSSVTSAIVPATIDFKVSVLNPDGVGPLYGAVLRDTLFAPDGSVTFDKAWALDTLNPGDLINLSYSIAFAASTTPGTYRNVTSVSGMAYHPYAGSATSTQTVSTISFGQGGEVLGAATTTDVLPALSGGSCQLRLATFLARGLRNRAGEVTKLQTFLNTMGAKLPVTGTFGPMTQAAVRAFQRAHGIPATGSVYTLTQRAINGIACTQ